MNCLKSELKTFLYARTTIIFALILLVVSSAYYYKSYISAQDSAKHVIEMLSEMDELKKQGNIVDDSDLTERLSQIHTTYRPGMTINNSFAILLGLGMILIPIISALYMGREYSGNRAIRQKITFYGLNKILMHKSIIMLIFIICFMFVYSVAACCISLYCWGPLSKILNGTGIDFTQNSISPANFKVIFLCVWIFLFYSCVSMLVSAFSKSSTFGIISVIGINYIVLPSKFSPHNIVYKLVNETIYSSPASPFEFMPKIPSDLSAVTASLIFFVYFILILAGIYTVSIFQRQQ